MPKIERALLSVTDKHGLLEFASALHRLGVELISTGGTARALRDGGLPVRDVSDVTGFPEMLDGRVKTIHPVIAGGILAIRSNPSHMQSLSEHHIAPIQMVVVNLYAFEEHAARPGISRDELIEQIDIGGPTLIRAAAKNFNDVAVVVSPGQYGDLLQELHSQGGSLTSDTHWRLAKQAFEQTAAYDAAIAAKLATLDQSAPTAAIPNQLTIHARRSLSLRYGENPHQQAALYPLQAGGIASAEQLHGKELSYNNLVDLDAAYQLACEFQQPAAIIVKHTNPCGCAQQTTLVDAYRMALAADPVSAFGGVLAFNRTLDAETAAEVSKLFTEAIVAPDFAPQALSILQAKKNLRLVKVQPVAEPELVIKSISGGLLVQTPDPLTETAFRHLQVKTARHPTPDEQDALHFAWTVVKHVKSNAIVYARQGQLISAGAGQMSRVDAVKVGAMKAVLPLAGCVLASDAFFPFPDGLEEAARHGITAVIQPGGSVKDNDVIAAADRLGLAMVFTGVRHFRH